MIAARVLYPTLFLLLSTFSQTANAWQIFVSPDGSDQNPGSFTHPIKSLEQAKVLLKSPKKSIVFLRGGIYRLERPVRFTELDSGTSENPVVIRAYPGEHPILCGSRKIHCQWKPYRDGIFQSEVPKGIVFETLYANDQPQVLARYPNRKPGVTPFGGFAADAVSPVRLSKWKNPKGAYLHCLHGGKWGGYHYQVDGVSDKGTAILKGGWQNNRPERGPHNKFRFVENVFEELDADNEWYLDQKQSNLYWKPEKGTNPSDFTIEIPVVDHLIEIQGKANNPVKHIHIQGIKFRHTNRTFMKTKEPLLRSDWTFYRGAAIWLKNSFGCRIDRCHLSQLGGNAILVDGFARKVSVSSNEISYVGGSGISFVGNANAVRSPNFHYSKYTQLGKLDKKIGPKSDQYPADCEASDNLIYRTGEIEKQSAGVQIAMAAKIRVAHNSIYDMPRAGINVGDGTWGGHIIEHNDVFDTVKETSDHGSFNSWGRDRYWSSNPNRVNQYVKTNADLPLLDAVHTTHIRNNRFRCDHGWDIDLDDGSSNYQIYNNLCLKNGIKLREGFFRHVFNNVVVNNSIHVHVWYENSGDVIEHNILGSWYFPIRMPKKWGKAIDFNLFDISEKPSRWNQQGRDVHSVIRNPEFIDPKNGDYRVRHSSPAWQLGFHNFPMDQFGVRPEHLKKKARTPKLPVYDAKLKVGQKPSRDGRTHNWLGGKVKNLVGLGEVSATGMSNETGVLVVSVPKGSALEKMGLKEGDVVFEFWSSPVENLNSLKRHYNSRPKDSRIPLTVMRNQAKITVHID